MAVVYKFFRLPRVKAPLASLKLHAFPLASHIEPFCLTVSDFRFLIYRLQLFLAFDVFTHFGRGILSNFSKSCLKCYQRTSGASWKAEDDKWMMCEISIKSRRKSRPPESRSMKFELIVLQRKILFHSESGTYQLTVHQWTRKQIFRRSRSRFCLSSKIAQMDN